MKTITISAPAKVNLGLWVGRRRPDGYHDIVTTMVPLELSDTIEITRAPSGIRLKTTGINLHLPEEKNLAYRAAELFFSVTGISAGCVIKITKRIPPGAGLGGGSSDAAAVLKGLNRLLDNPLAPAALKQLGMQLGSDVPFFIKSAPAVARGRGERIRPVKIPRLNLILLVPGFGISTPWAYHQIDRLRRKLTACPISPKILTLKLRRKELAGVAAQLYNSFEPVVFRRYPQLAQAKKVLLASGACAASLSGSGSTVYGLFNRQDPMAVSKLEKSKPAGFSLFSTRSRPSA